MFISIASIQLDGGQLSHNEVARENNFTIACTSNDGISRSAL